MFAISFIPSNDKFENELLNVSINNLKYVIYSSLAMGNHYQPISVGDYKIFFIIIVAIIPIMASLYYILKNIIVKKSKTALILLILVFTVVSTYIGMIDIVIKIVSLILLGNLYIALRRRLSRK